MAAAVTIQVLALTATLALSAAAMPAQAPPAFKIQVEETGAYRVTFEDLVLGDLRPASAGIGLQNAGEPVPVWVEDGGDGVFDPGDWIEFLGEHLRGESTYLDEFSRYNTYFLGFDHSQPLRRQAVDAGDADAAGPFHAVRTHQHLEQDLVRLRLPWSKDAANQEVWYWVKLSHLNKEPYVEILDLTDLDQRPGATVDLRIEFRGWSRPSFKSNEEAGDHAVKLSIDGKEIGVAEWNGTEPYLVEISDLPADQLISGENRLELLVPRRRLGKDDRLLVDVLMLNWIEVTAPLAGRIGDWQERLELVESEAADTLRLVSDPDRELLLYGDGGSRIRTTAAAPDGEALIRLPADESTFVVTAADRLRSPAAVVPDHPSRLADPDNRADYLMIAHRSLMEAAEPLAEHHRGRGLEVMLIDVDDVFDEFGHGIPRPQALKAFIDFAYHSWQEPKPRFVLLVGDASWDARNEFVHEENYPSSGFRNADARRFSRIDSTPYAKDAHLNRRGLIPTWSNARTLGQAANDNYFVAVDGDDNLPDLAIGRLPVVEPDEVAAIVDKTLRYANTPAVGPWRRNTLFITNESRSFQNQSDNMAASMARAGFLPHRIYPASSETSNEQHSQRLLEAFDEGQLLVHFYGHGGRYIWRTGPPDLEKNHDLFTLDHLDQLQPNGRPAVVVSMTCYSAPFDHPNADSIGEKLLRLPERGAVAILAASWRNTPTGSWGQITLEELTAPGATIGEAIQRSKHRINNSSFVDTYNLLGDPASAVALPTAEITVGVEAEADGGWQVRGTVGLEGFSGRLLVELTDSTGYVVDSTVVETEDGTFAVDFAPAPGARRILAYAWDDRRQHDAFGAVELTSQKTEVASETTSTASSRSR